MVAKQKEHPLYGYMDEYDREYYEHYRNTRQLMRAQEKLLRAYWRKIGYLTKTTEILKREEAKKEEKLGEEKRKGAEEAIQGETAGQRVEISDEHILSVIQEAPEGITLPEIGKSLGVHYVTISRTVKALVERGKVKKEEKRYFAVAEN